MNKKVCLICQLERLPKNFILKNANVNQPMVFPGLFFGSNISWDAFGISRFEVSNIEFKEFLDQGGYENPEFWDFPIVIEGKVHLQKYDWQIYRQIWKIWSWQLALRAISKRRRKLPCLKYFMV